MTDWKKRFVTGAVVVPLIIYLLKYQHTTTILAQFITFMLHNEYSKIIGQILKFNSSESDNWYIETMEQSIVELSIYQKFSNQFIRLPTHYLLTAAALSSNAITMHFHFIVTVTFIFTTQSSYAFSSSVVSEYLILLKFHSSSNRRKERLMKPFLFNFQIENFIYQHSSKFQLMSYVKNYLFILLPLLEFILFVYPLIFPIIAFEFKQGAAINLVWIISAWQTDNGALFLGTFLEYSNQIGSLMGKHLFAPKISPKKTWEGVSGGIFLSVTTALILSQVHFLEMTSLDSLHTKHFLIISVIVSIVSVYGDFVESFLKRVADVKDSGTFFPGHGGVLDRMDSLCFSAPFVYLYLRMFMSNVLDTNDN